MAEYFIDGLVLDRKPAGELDNLIYLYTKQLGKVVVKAKSSRKITSKLSVHLEPLNFIKARLVDKKDFQIVDALTSNRCNQLRPPLASPEKFKQTMEALQFINAMTPELQPDAKIWLAVKKSLNDLAKNQFSYKPLLEVFGFASDFAECAVCHKQPVNSFSKTEQIFLCRKCASKIPPDEVILI